MEHDIVRPVAVRRRGEVRTFARLSRRVAGELADATGAVAALIDAQLGDQVLTDRLGGDHPGGRRLADARTRLARTADAMIVADVRTFYASVTPGMVETALRRLGADRLQSSRVRRVLERVHAAGWSGLPVGPRASGILGNAVLQPVDQALRERGFRHLRWVDDIAAPASPGVLDAMQEGLGAIGLRLNTSKCGTVDVAEFRRTWVGSAA